MKTSIVDVSGMLSPLSARGVEKQLARVRGVEKVEVNYVAGSATITYDEAQTDLKTIKAKVEECGYHCGGEMVPRHVCTPEDPPADAAATTMPGHVGHVAGVERVEPESPDRHVTVAQAARHAEHGGAKDEMAHEMGHGAAWTCKPWCATCATVSGSA